MYMRWFLKATDRKSGLVDRQVVSTLPKQRTKLSRKTIQRSKSSAADLTAAETFSKLRAWRRATVDIFSTEYLSSALYSHKIMWQGQFQTMCSGNATISGSNRRHSRSLLSSFAVCAFIGRVARRRRQLIWGSQAYI